MFRGARPSHKFECFWKVSYHPDEKNFQHREMSWTVFGGARLAVHLNVVESLHNIKRKRFFNAAKWAGPWKGCWGARPSHKLECFYMVAEHPCKWILQHREQNWAVFGEARPNHKFECFWKTSYHPDEKSFQHREMSWTVFGGARLAVNLNVVELLLNFETKWFFNPAKWAVRWQGMLGSAAQP